MSPRGPVPSGSNRATLQAVARKAGVAVSTASRALHGTGPCAPETVRKVRRAAVELGYEPDGRLRQNPYGYTRGFVAIVLDLDTVSAYPHGLGTFWFRTLNRLTHNLAVENIAVAQVTANASDMLRDLPVDIIHVMSASNDLQSLPDLADVKRTSIGPPGAPLGRDLYDYATYHFVGMTHRALDHLHSRGAHRIAVHPGLAGWWVTSIVRRAVKEWGLDHGVLVEIVDSAAPAIELEAHFRNAIQRGCDAILDFGSQSAMLVRLCAGEGRKIPDDIMIMSVSEAVAEQLLVPSVTTVDLEASEYGDQLTRVILNAMAGGPPLRLVCDPPITVRESTLRGAVPH